MRRTIVYLALSLSLLAGMVSSCWAQNFGN